MTSGKMFWFYEHNLYDLNDLLKIGATYILYIMLNPRESSCGREKNDPLCLLNLF